MDIPTALAQRPHDPQPRAESLIRALVERLTGALPEAAAFAEKLRDATGTRLRDWIDTIALPAGDAALETRLLQAHFLEEPCPEDVPFARAFIHLRGGFPRLLIGREPDAPLQAWLACEDVADFCARHAEEPALVVEGAPLAPLRRARFAANQEAELWAIARVGERGDAIATLAPEAAVARAELYERFRRRRRHLGSASAGFAYARALIEEAIERVGQDATCALFFRAERAFWQRRCRAAGVQRARQDALGLGWANADHHTYRCSREHFAALIDVLERLGFTLRERFYAGREAGWGAQVLEQASAGVVVFADVDLSLDEVREDFTHVPLEPRAQLGTVGLWCALHGESFLEAGMHHLASLADFGAGRAQLERAGVGCMAPFTELPHLKQAFTRGERWQVAPGRLEALVEAGHLSRAQADEFAADGAIGAHLELVERNDGFRGFNQAGISEIIAATDPRDARLS